MTWYERTPETSWLAMMTLRSVGRVAPARENAEAGIVAESALGVCAP